MGRRKKILDIEDILLGKVVIPEDESDYDGKYRGENIYGWHLNEKMLNYDDEYYIDNTTPEKLIYYIEFKEKLKKEEYEQNENDTSLLC